MYFLQKLFKGDNVENLVVHRLNTVLNRMFTCARAVIVSETIGISLPPNKPGTFLATTSLVSRNLHLIVKIHILTEQKVILLKGLMSTFLNGYLTH